MYLLVTVVMQVIIHANASPLSFAIFVDERSMDTQLSLDGLVVFQFAMETKARGTRQVP